MSFKSALEDAKHKVEHPFGGKEKYDPKNARPEPKNEQDGIVEPGKDTGEQTVSVVNVDPETGQGKEVT